MRRGVFGIALGLALVTGPGSAAPGGSNDAPHDMTIPGHWRELPELSRSAAAPDGVTVVSRRGWGDPVGGCFLLVQEIETAQKASADALRASLVATLEAAKLEVHAAALADDPAVIRFTGAAPGRPGATPSSVGETPDPPGAGFEGAMLIAISAEAKGKLRARSTTCFYNQREPELSEQLCKALFKQFAASR